MVPQRLGEFEYFSPSIEKVCDTYYTKVYEIRVSISYE